MTQGQDKILVFIPMYNCEKQIGRVLEQFDEVTQQYAAEILIVDNRSTDKSVAAAKKALNALKNIKTTLLINDHNYGLGGSHKVAFNYAIQHQYDYCIVLHGDDQGHIHDLIGHLKEGSYRQFDCLLGARFMRGATLVGYSKSRTLGNHVYNLLYSTVSRKRLYDLGAGLNLYKVSFLQKLGYLSFADNLTFNYHAILATVALKAKFSFFPLTWREEDQISNVKLVRQSLQSLKILWQFFINKSQFLQTDFSTLATNKTYTSTPYESTL